MFALAIHEGDDAERVLSNLRDKHDMKRPRVVYAMNADGSPRVRLDAGDHLSMTDSVAGPNWYK